MSKNGSSMADILFIHPGNQKRVYQDLSNEFTAIAPPLWTSLLAHAVRSAGSDAAVYDVNVLGWDEDLPAELMQQYQPDLVVIMAYGHTPSASTQTMPAALRIADDLKACCDVPLALGGLHPSALPERSLRESKADFVIQGEGVYTIPALLRELQETQKWESVPGLWYWDNETPRFSAPAPLVNDLDRDLPGYAWDLLPDLSRYRAHNMHCFQDFAASNRDDFADVRSPYMTLSTSLGCPYRCHYCSINALFGKPGIRYWSVEHVLGWFDELHQRGVRNVRLDDELFVLSPKRVEAICNGLIDRGYEFNLWAYARVDTVEQTLLQKMKRAGFNWICLGIESAAEHVRSGVNKSIRADIPDVVRQIQDAGIYVLGNYVFGLPEDNEQTMRQTLQMAIDLNCEFANFYVVLPYPGSGLFNDATAQGLIPDSWVAFSQHGYDTVPMPTRHLAPKDVLAFRDQAFVSYFDRPAYRKMMDQRFGAAVNAHLDRMLAIRVKRRLLE
jgi:radical SAM superfamily enzyme YgiQ (UPF0313 family)